MRAYNGFSDLGDLGEEIIPGAAHGVRIISVGERHLLSHFAIFDSGEIAACCSDVVQSLGGSSGGSGGAMLLTLAMAISAVGALHVVVLTGARIPYAMARDGVFFQFSKRVHPSFHTPTGALMFLGAMAALLALSGTYEELYSLFVFAAWIFFALTAIALIRLRIKEPTLFRPYRTWGYPLSPLIFLIAAVALTVNLWMERPMRSTLGLLVILGGIPFFYRWRKSPGQQQETH